MMKKIVSAILVVLFVPGLAYAQEQKNYDPQNTMLALNMAIVSVNRILTTEDRIVLEWEYDNIINRLALGNIESDSEMKQLYKELLDFLTGKKLRQQDAEKIRASQQQREREAYYRNMNIAFANLRAPVHDNLKATQKTTANNFGIGAHVGIDNVGGSLSYSRVVTEAENLHLPVVSFVTKISVNTISSMGIGYYGYQAAREQVHREISEELWRLKREEIEACNNLQKRLLDSSWGLVRKYGLPNEYRLTQENVKEFLGILDEKDPSKRLGRLKFIERKFQVYPPYWFYRAYAALDSGNYEECRRCFEKFDEVWRPVLNYDPYKLEAAKFKVQDLAQNVKSEETVEEIKRQLEVIRDYTPVGDWKSNIFSGIFYYVLGEKQKGMDYLEFNIMSDYESDISGMFLAKMKDDNMRLDDLPEFTGKLQAEIFLAALNDKDMAEVLREFFDEYGYKTFHGIDSMTQLDFDETIRYFDTLEAYCGGLFITGCMYAKGIHFEKDYLKASKCFNEAALLGDIHAQFELANLYYDGGPNLERDYMKAYLWYQIVLSPHVAYGEDNEAYGGSILISTFYNVFSLGGLVNADDIAFNIGQPDISDIKAYAGRKINAMEGFGLFNLAKGSKEERLNARKEAQKIIGQIIPENQKKWK